MSASMTGRTPVSIVCVFNDAEVLASCLERSILLGIGSAPGTQFIPVDNRGGEFSTAGAALNHGARLARNEVVTFVHQDVFLHSLTDLETAARHLVDSPDIGVLGAVGVDRHGRVIGRIRDRVLALGERAPHPRGVETVDEVLFLVRRDRVLRDPLAEDAHLGWHAYAVEYCARMRNAGLRVAVTDVPLTHNSLTTNLLNLDVAHRWVGDAYPNLLPLRTTCGTIQRSAPSGGTQRLARRARGLSTWWRESVAARVATAPDAASVNVVLADIRFHIDDVARSVGADSIRALDLAGDDEARTSVDSLTRFGRSFSAATVSADVARQTVIDRSDGEVLVLANLAPGHLGELLSASQSAPLVGLSQEAGLWAVFGASLKTDDWLQASRRNRPFAGLFPVPAHRQRA